MTQHTEGPEDWRSEYAYTLGVQAFIYGFPYIYFAQLRHAWVTTKRDTDVVPYSAVNEFWHAARPLDAGYRDGGCPSTDTLYSLSWVDLRDGPVILSHPDMRDRYFSFQVAAFTSDNVDYVGQRTTGAAAGDFALIGPGWQGDLPDGVQAMAPSPTPWVLLLGRTLVDGLDDAPAARALMLQYRLTPLREWAGTATNLGGSRDVYVPTPGSDDPLGPWRTLNAMLAENPPPAHHELLLAQYARVGIGAGGDVDGQPPAIKQGLARAAAAGMALLRQQFSSGDWATIIDGWRYPPPEEGRFADNFLGRAADQSLAGIATNDPAEAVYLVNFQDHEGKPFAAGERYRLHFEAANLPPVDAFWSLSAYTAQDLNLIPNSAHRYSVGDRTPGLNRHADGGLTLHLQAEPPADADANWLPSSADQPWFVILRLYRPRPEILSSTWHCPPIMKEKR